MTQINRSKWITARILLAYFMAKLYQFFGTFPKTRNVIVPEVYSVMSCWHFTHLLCLLSNKFYPQKVEDGQLSSAMIYAIKDKVSPDTPYKEFVDLIRQKGIQNI